MAGLSSKLALEVDQAISENDLKKGTLGQKISLKGIWSKGHLYRSQHVALRALMLCQAIFLNPPWARKAKYKRTPDGHGGYQSERDGYAPFYTGGELKAHSSVVRNMSEGDIKKRILCYIPVGGVSGDDIAKAAEMAVGQGTIDYTNLTRDSELLFQNAICFDAVSLWLFKSGFVSIRWLTREGPSLQADTANDMLGDGKVITVDELDRMPRGMLFNFHGGKSGSRDNRDVCHWGVSLGGGMGAAANTTAKETTLDGRTIQVTFTPGSSLYGIFRMRESYEVCKLKYGKERKLDTVIRQIDPSLVRTYY